MYNGELPAQDAHGWVQIQANSEGEMDKLLWLGFDPGHACPARIVTALLQFHFVVFLSKIYFGFNSVSPRISGLRHTNQLAEGQQ